MPTVVFLIAAAMAFSTGTSWGTMAILTPLSIGLALQLDPAGGPEGAITLATCGSVLAGAIFWRSLFSHFRHNRVVESREWLRPRGSCAYANAICNCGWLGVYHLRNSSSSVWCFALDQFDYWKRRSCCGRPWLRETAAGNTLGRVDRSGICRMRALGPELDGLICSVLMRICRVCFVSILHSESRTDYRLISETEFRLRIAPPGPVEITKGQYEFPDYPWLHHPMVVGVRRPLRPDIPLDPSASWCTGCRGCTATLCAHRNT